MWIAKWDEGKSVLRNKYRSKQSKRKWGLNVWKIKKKERIKREKYRERERGRKDRMGEQIVTPKVNVWAEKNRLCAE